MIFPDKIISLEFIEVMVSDFPIQEQASEFDWLRIRMNKIVIIRVIFIIGPNVLRAGPVQIFATSARLKTESKLGNNLQFENENPALG